MTLQSLTQSERKRLANNEYGKQYYQSNKEKIARYKDEYCHSRKGLVGEIYGSQRTSSKQRDHPMPDYSLKELRAWVFSQPNFNGSYQAWIESDFNTIQRPSCDRLDDYKPYTLSNLRLTTWQENKARGHADRKAGINNKNSKSVLQLTKAGELIAGHHSTMQAGRTTGVYQSNLWACCTGKRKSAGGFLWRFA